MAIVINGSGTVTGLAVGGLPDGTVDAGTLATNSVDSAELIDGAVDNSHMAAMAASKLTGALPAISGASLTGLKAGSSYFQAKCSGNTWSTLAANTKLPFDSTHYNVGSDYSTSNNRYIAPADGVYYFHFSAYTANADADNGFMFRKNGSASGIQDNHNAISAHNAEGDGDKTLHASLVVQLDQDEYVEVFTYTASDFYSGHSCWGGFRIA